MTKLWQTKQVAPQEYADLIAAVCSCGAFYIHSPRNRRDGQNNKSLRGIPLVSPGPHNPVRRNGQ